MTPAAATPVRMTYREACRQAIRDALTSDPRAFLMGEDVGLYGGCFAVTKGLLEEFGPNRIRDTPLAESALVGAGIGAAIAGMRPALGGLLAIGAEQRDVDAVHRGAAHHAECRQEFRHIRFSARSRRRADCTGPPE